MSGSPKVSVVVAAYRPGDGIERVIASLDRQTLPQDEFETIVVDDGSPDDTFERLEEYAATRPNMRVTRIPNSGWPSRPRNIATEMARGEYVLYMDHDDSLYPDALRRAAEYGAETRADLLSPKESKTTDVWWGMSALKDGNVPNAIDDGGIDRLLPMVPHKFYRRQFLLSQGIRFPEGRRMLWEDIYVNVEAYAKAEVVAVLADTPAYLWHSSASNNSKTYGPSSAEFWDRLDQLFAFIDRTLAEPRLAEARRSMLLHQYRGRVLGRFARMLESATADETARALVRARRLQDAYIPVEWDAHLGKAERARSLLVRAERPELLREVQESERTIAGRVSATAVEWRDGRLHLDVVAGYERRGVGPLTFRERDGRVLRDLPQPVLDALPADLADLTDDVGSFVVELGVRDRIERVTWQLDADAVGRFEPVEGGGVRVVATASTSVDLATAALGRPLEAPVYDFYAALRWVGASRGCGVRSTLAARPALVDGRASVVYANLTGNLSMDLAQRLRSVVKDGRPDYDAVTGRARSFVLPLGTVHVHGTTSIPSTVEFVPEATDAADRGGTVTRVPARLVGDERGARLEAGGAVPAGGYRLSFAAADEPALVSPTVVEVGRGGELRFAHEPVRRRPPAKTVQQRMREARGRAVRLAKAVRRRIRAGR